MPTSAPTNAKKILWVDDQISGFDSHIEELEDNNYNVLPVETAAEALASIGTGGEFDAVLVDLKLAEADGIDLLKKLYDAIEDKRRTKVIVVSSFLYDPVIRRRLLDLNMKALLLEKTHTSGEEGPVASFVERLEEALEQDDVAPPARQQFRGWDREASALDPFKISFEEYLASPLVVRLQLDQRAERATRPARKELAKKGVAWSLFCGSSHKPVSTANVVGDVPSDEEIFAIASRRRHPAYEFYERGEFEELTTARGVTVAGRPRGAGACPGMADYPFFGIRVSYKSESGAAMTFARDCHFDSGLDVTAFDLVAALRFWFRVETDKPAKFVQYDGRNHPFYLFSGEAEVERGRRGASNVTISGRAYPYWLDAPFCRRCADFACPIGEVCSRRHALLGRSLLVENGFVLDLQRIVERP